MQVICFVGTPASCGLQTHAQSDRENKKCGSECICTSEDTGMRYRRKAEMHTGALVSTRTPALHSYQRIDMYGHYKDTYPCRRTKSCSGHTSEVTSNLSAGGRESRPLEVAPQISRWTTGVAPNKAGVNLKSKGSRLHGIWMNTRSPERRIPPQRSPLMTM